MIGVGPQCPVLCLGRTGHASGWASIASLASFGCRLAARIWTITHWLTSHGFGSFACSATTCGGEGILWCDLNGPILAGRPVQGDDPITDAGLAHLSGLARLESLVLVGTVVTDDGVGYLAGLQRLKRLKISSPHITDRGVPQLCQLKGLSKLCLVGTSISDDGVARLRSELPNCQVIGPAGLQEHEKSRLGIHVR